MLSEVFSLEFVVFSMFGLAFVVFLSIYMLRLGAYCRDAVEFVQNQNKNAVSLRKMAELETAVTDLSEAYDCLIKGHRKLRSRIGMREKRQRDKNDAELDPEARTAIEKSQLRARAKANGLIR